MENDLTENEFIIDLSSTKNTSQLVMELSSIMEHPDAKEKKICLKLGDIDLRQAQLLSIKALIESMSSELGCIYTSSEQTEAVVSGLEIKVVKTEVQIKEEDIAESDNTEENVEADVEQPVIQTFADLKNNEVITTTEGVRDEFTEESMSELSEIIPAEHFATNFENVAFTEGLLTNEEVSKYIMMEPEEEDDATPKEEIEVDTKTLPTLYVEQNLRSGQTVTYEGNVLILGDAHPGSEIVADGDITVWGILGGIAHAGANGNVSAKVRALKLNAIQLRIAGLYARRNDTLNVPYVQRSSEFTPEEAQIENSKIVIYKKLRRN